MAPPSQATIEEKLAALQANYKLTLPGKVEQIEQLWSSVIVGGDLNESSIVDCHRMAHTLVGTGGTFGAVIVSTAARELEQALKLLVNKTELTSEYKSTVTVLISKLKTIAINWQPSKIPYIQPIYNDAKADRNGNLIYLAEDDELLAEDLILQLEKNGFKVKHFLNTTTFAAAFSKEIPSAVIMDVMFREGRIAGADTISRLKAELNVSPPVVFISTRNDMQARLAAANAGAQRYFSKPVDVNKLSQTLDGLIKRTATKPFRILFVDDDTSLLTYYETILLGAGLEVKTLSNPLGCLDILEEFKPDVIVLDVYMPECSGPELAQVIRQDDSWANTPIMFLSTEINLELQLDAMNLGGESFMTKPFTAKHLISVVSAKAKRARWTHRINDELEMTLRESEFQLITSNQHDIVSTSDVSGRIISVNEKFIEISGYSREELIGENHRILKSRYHPDSFFEEMWRIIASGQIWHGTICNLNKQGDEYWVDSTIVPFLDEKGKPYKYVSARTDITKVLQSEERLERSQEFANIGTWDWNISTGDVFWSDGVWSLFGYEKEATETSYDNFMAAVHPEDREKVSKAISDCVDNGAEFNIEHRVIWPDGSVHWLHESGDAVRAEDGTAIHMLGVIQDITERIESADKQRETEERFAFAVDGAGDGVWDWDMRTNDMNFSGLYMKMLGYAEDELPHHVDTWVNSVHPDDLPRVQQNLQDFLEDKIPSYAVELRLRCKDGRYKWILCRATIVDRDNENKPLRMIGIHSDITQGKVMELQVEKQKSLLDMLHQTTTSFVEKGDIHETMNGMLDTLLNLTDSEYGFTGEVFYNDDGSPYLKTHAITNIVWDDKSQVLYNEFEKKGFEFHNLNTLFGHVLTSRSVVVSNNPKSDPRAGGLPPGHPDMNSFLGIPVFYGSELVGMYGIANRVEGYDDEIQQYLKPFNTSYGVMINSKRMMEKEESHRNELIESKEEAETANRAKSQFLSSMSHELRTPMNAIMGFGQLLSMEIDQPLSESQQENVTEIMKASDHLLELINEVLDLAKIEAGRIDLSIEDVLLGNVVIESLQLILPLAQRRGITIDVFHGDTEISIDELAHDSNVVRADYTRTKQVIINLLSNAVKYNTKNGKITIKYEIPDKHNIRVSVTDTGNGLDQEQQAQLFTAFNRLGAETSNIEGTGIGLVITQNIVELMGGNISVESEPGVGSTFWFELPIGAEELTDSNKDDPSIMENLELDDQRTVLYIEDNPANLRLVTQLLSRLPNLHMWSAHEPLLGLELAVENRPDVILLDINLPGMDGFEVLKLLKKQDETRDIPVIAISANAMRRDIEKGFEAGFDDYITKPININELLVSVDERLTK